MHAGLLEAVNRYNSLSEGVAGFIDVRGLAATQAGIHTLIVPLVEEHDRTIRGVLAGLGPVLEEHNRGMNAIRGFLPLVTGPLHRASVALAALVEQQAGVSRYATTWGRLVQGSQLTVATEALATFLRTESVALHLHVSPDVGRAALGRLGEMAAASADLYSDWSQPTADLPPSPHR
jgi:hypothetical protein